MIPPTVALSLLTLVATAALGRVLGGLSFPVLVAMVSGAVVHLLAWVCRRWRAPASGAVVLVTVGLLTAWLVLPHTTSYGLPGLDTLRAAVREIVAVAAARGDGVPILELSRGLGVLLVVIVGFSAYLADHAAFGMRSPLLALLPAFTLFLGGTSPGGVGVEPAPLLSFLTAALAFLAVDRGRERRRLPSFAAADRTVGAGAVSSSAVALGVVALAGALVVGPRLPGFGQAGLIRPGGAIPTLVGDGPGAGTDSLRFEPLLDIRDSLGRLSEVQVFTVEAAQPRYWRLTTLDTFDGQIWSARNSGPPGGEARPAEETAALGFVPLIQRVRIDGLVSEWLPAAATPSQVSDSAVVRDAVSGGVRVQPATSRGLTYQVTSLVPQALGPELRNLGWPSSSAADRLRSLPASVSPRLRAEARRVVAGTESAYDAALALQNYFRDNFGYDLSVAPGHSGRALDRFVFELKKGYCEQFAAAFAAMARSVGLPARVAVGFTPGEWTAERRYRVRGVNAHAWPEVYLAGAGWLPFEPTPGRGEPGSTGHTGVVPALSDPTIGNLNQPIAPPITVPAVTSPTTTAPPVSGPGQPDPTTAPVETNPLPVPGTGGARSGRRWLWPAAGAGASLLALGLPAAVPGLKRRRRRRRRAAAADAERQILVAWLEASEMLAVAGLGRRPDETLLEHATRVAAAGRVPAVVNGPLELLNGCASDASYSPGPLDARRATDARRAADTVQNAVRGALPRRLRLAHHFDPRPLWSAEEMLSGRR